MTPFVDDADFKLYVGDARDVLAQLPAGAAHAVVTSPPYLDARADYPSPTLIDYGEIFHQLARVCRGAMLWNVGRLFRDHEEQLWWLDLIWRAKHAGWKLLDTRIWIKPNANPIRGEVFADRHEYVLVLGRRDARELNVDDIRVPYAPESIARLERGWTSHMGVKGDSSRRSQHGVKRNEPHPLGGRPPSYFQAATGAEKGNPHPAPMPRLLAGELVCLASWPGQTILDPFAGSGTTAEAARILGRRSIGIELSQEYATIAAARLAQQPIFLEEPAA